MMFDLDRFADRAITELDRGLRTLAGVHTPRRPSPAASVAEAELTEYERREAAALMRVNHCGEVCAQALYQGQALVAENPRTGEALRHAAQEEEDHLGWSHQRIRELDGHTSLLNPLWYAGSLAIGIAAGRFGERWNLGFLRETERQVGEHLQSHLDRLSTRDGRTRALVAAMQRDELGHAEMAGRLGAAELPAPARLAMRAASRVMTRLSYWI